MEKATKILKELLDSENPLQELLKKHEYDIAEIDNLLFIAAKLNKRMYIDNQAKNK